MESHAPRDDVGPYFSDEADRPLLAVLPFRAMSDDPACAAEALAIARGLSAELGSNSDLRVVSHHASFAFAGRDTAVIDIGHQLGCRTLLDAQVRNDGEVLTVTLELISSESAASTILARRPYGNPATRLLDDLKDEARTVQQRMA